MNQTYNFLDFTELERLALNDRIKFLEQQKSRYEIAISNYKDNKDLGKESLDSMKITYENIKNLLSLAQDKLSRVDQMSKKEVITAGVKLDNYIYNRRDKKINKLEEKAENYHDAIDNMADGKVKDKLMKKYKKISKKLDAKKARNTKLGEKQISKITEMEMSRDRKKRREAKLVAEAKVYGNQAIAARNAAAIPGISKLEKASYQHKQKKYNKKHKKAYNKLQKLRSSNVRVRSANPINMAINAINRFRQANRRHQQTQRHP